VPSPSNAKPRASKTSDPTQSTSSRLYKTQVAEALQEKERRQEAKQLQTSFLDFFAACWPELDPAPLRLNWHHEALAEHLEAVSRGKIRKLLINLPPRHTKTLLVSVAWPAWVWAQDLDRIEFPLMGPHCSFMCLSYGGDLALDHALLMKRLITSDWYRARWGKRVSLMADKEAASKFDNSAGGTRISGSMSGGVTGRGADYRIFDDPHNVKTAESQIIREDVVRNYDTALKNRVTDPKTSVEVIVMQRTHEGDLSGHVLAKDADFVHLMLPAEFEPDRHCITYLDGAAWWADPREKPGELLWPEQWGASELAPFKEDDYTWAGQYQQRPAPRGGGVIQRDWWQLWGDESDPELVKPENARFKKHPQYSFVIGVLDTAYTDKSKNDPSAMAIWGVFQNLQGFPNVMLAHAWQERLIFPDLLSKVLATSRKFRIDALLIEDKTAGPPIAQELRANYREESFQVYLIPIGRASGDKMTRLQATTLYFQQGMIWAPNKPWAEKFLTEVCLFPKALHDECVDLTSMGLRWLRTQGVLETKREIEAVEAEARRRPGGRVAPLYPGT
jgi:predicted phage terminase large subunit-like protein